MSAFHFSAPITFQLTSQLIRERRTNLACTETRKQSAERLQADPETVCFSLGLTSLLDLIDKQKRHIFLSLFIYQNIIIIIIIICTGEARSKWAFVISHDSNQIL